MTTLEQPLHATLGHHGSALSEHGSALREAFDPKALMARLADELVEMVPAADASDIGLLDEEGRVVFVAMSEALRGLGGRSIGIASSLSGRAMGTVRVLRCDDAATDPWVDRVMLDKVNMVSQISVPLVREGTAFGVINVLARRSHAFSDRDMATCASLAGVLAGIVSSTAEIARILDQLDQPGLALGSGERDGAHDHEERGEAEEGEAEVDPVVRFVTRVLSPAVDVQLDMRRQIQAVLKGRRFTMAYQPIVDLRGEQAVALEALARFEDPGISPDRVFSDAEAVGLGVELELAAVEAALGALEALPGTVDLAVNLGPATLMSPKVVSLLKGCEAYRVVIELTEHARVVDYEVLGSALAPLRSLGVRISVDDTGAGYASLAHIVQIAPEFVKLDRSIVMGVDEDPVRRSLVRALVGFAHELGAKVVGEGIEGSAELAALASLGVDFGQGFYLGRPSMLPVQPTRVVMAG